MSIHPTEPVFASGSGDSTIRIYDYELNDQMIPEAELGKL